MAVSSIALLCLTLNIYHEARGEPIDGMRAVALVTRNRANFYNKSICEVVYSPKQFSWTIYKPKATDPKPYKLAESVALEVLNGEISDLTAGSTFYHRKDIRPAWASKFRYVKTIGNHKFYFSLQKPKKIYG